MKTDLTAKRAAEESVLSAVHRICELAQDGADPTAAAVKAAEELSLGPPLIRLACRSYNTGAVNHQRENSAGALEKFATIPLADAEAVIRETHPADREDDEAPAKQASGVAIEYALPPRNKRRVTKAAAAPLRLPRVDDPQARALDSEHRRQRQRKEARARREQLQRAVADARAELSGKTAELESHVKKLAQWCCKAEELRPFTVGHLKAAANQRYGPHGLAVVENAASHSGPERYRPSPPMFPKRAIDWQREPFSWIDSAVKLAREVVQGRKLLAAARKQAAALEHELKEELRTGRLQRAQILVDAEPGAVKEAFPKWINAPLFTTTMATNLYNQASKRQDPDELIRDAALELDSPEHRNEIRRIRVQTMLNDLLNNDEVISGHDPDRVLTAYNEIAGAAPRLADHSLYVRPLLRKHLTQGAIEPFESKELADLEGSIAGTTQSPQFLVQRPKPMESSTPGK